MQYKPTHDWLIAKKQSAPAVDPIVRGIIRPNNPAQPHHFAEVALRPNDCYRRLAALCCELRRVWPVGVDIRGLQP